MKRTKIRVKLNDIRTIEPLGYHSDTPGLSYFFAPDKNDYGLNKGWHVVHDRSGLLVDRNRPVRTMKMAMYLTDDLGQLLDDWRVEYERFQTVHMHRQVCQVYDRYVTFGCVYIHEHWTIGKLEQELERLDRDDYIDGRTSKEHLEAWEFFKRNSPPFGNRWNSRIVHYASFGWSCQVYRRESGNWVHVKWL